MAASLASLHHINFGMTSTGGLSKAPSSISRTGRNYVSLPPRNRQNLKFLKQGSKASQELYSRLQCAASNEDNVIEEVLDAGRAQKVSLRAATAVVSDQRRGVAADVVTAFYDAINRRDIEGALMYIAEDCIYEDMIYSKPFTGRESGILPIVCDGSINYILLAIKSFFTKVLNLVPEDFVFVIDDISPGDTVAVGMVWHAEVGGKAMPFSRGCSFYRCDTQADGSLQIVYGRDIPESVPKMGDAALVILKYASMLLKRIS